MGNQLRTILFLGILTALLVVLGGAVAPNYIWVFAGLAVVMNVLSYFFSDRIVLAMHHAREIPAQADPRLHRVVGELAERAGIPKPRIYMIADDTPNAFATGRNPQKGVVAVTTGISRILSERELRGVLSHELAHIRNRDILIQTIAAVIASVISSVAMALRWGFLLGGARNDDREGGGAGQLVGALALSIVAPIAATVLQLAISRSREFLADEKGAEISRDPNALADALEALERGNRAASAAPAAVQTAPALASLYIVNPLHGGGILSLFSTHPPIAERVRRLRQLAQKLG